MVQFKVVPILPKKHNYPINYADILEVEIEKVLKGYVAPKLEQAMYRRQFGWKQKVNIQTTYSRRARLGQYTGAAVYVRPFGRNKRIWTFLTLGVPRHPIHPKRKGYLFIKGGQGGYSSKTAPNNVYGRASSYDLAASYYTHGSVNHPGIQARHFEQEIIKELGSQLVAAVIQAVQRSLQ